MYQKYKNVKALVLGIQRKLSQAKITSFGGEIRSTAETCTSQPAYDFQEKYFQGHISQVERLIHIPSATSVSRYR